MGRSLARRRKESNGDAEIFAACRETISKRNKIIIHALIWGRKS